MKAIYINLDPYLQAVADWLNAGKPGAAPTFNPLPLAVTIPLGEDAAILCPSGGEKTWEPIDGRNPVTIDGQTVEFWQDAEYIPEDAIAVKTQPGLSALAPEAKYWVQAVTGDTTATIVIQYDPETGASVYITLTVLVRRETASGPVDLVDFTPPAAVTADAINAALVAAGNGALEGVDLGGAILRRKPDEGSDIPTMVDNAGPLESADDDVLKIGSASA